ncbi:ATP-binding protein [Streptomyces uncialis]|uniref:ATP-binding protein n=1 Tax=Streptomyces uncialis TaxID=1048205 RepID=UPI00381A8094
MSHPHPLTLPASESYRFIAPNTPRAPRIARDWVGSLLRTTDHPALVDAARLCMSEVVTNAHRHTRTRLIHIEVTVGPAQVLVHVHDDQPRNLPVPELPRADEAESGRGLALVAAYADDWGATGDGECGERGGTGVGVKSVWFALAERGAAAR